MIDHAHLTGDPAWADDRHLHIAHGHRSRALDDDEGFAATHRAFLDEHVARRHVGFVDELGDAGQLTVVAAGKQRQPRKSLDLAIPSSHPDLHPEGEQRGPGCPGPRLLHRPP